LLQLYNNTAGQFVCVWGGTQIVKLVMVAQLSFLIGHQMLEVVIKDSMWICRDHGNRWWPG